MTDSSYSTTSWTRQDASLEDGGILRIYRREPLTIATNGTVEPISGGLDTKGKVHITVSKTFPNGSAVVPVVEIYVGQNQRHPKSYGGFPEPRPWMDWGNCNRVAISFEGEDSDGNLVKEYAFAEDSWNFCRRGTRRHSQESTWLLSRQPALHPSSVSLQYLDAMPIPRVFGSATLDQTWPGNCGQNHPI
jgi:hypothetical protein